MDCALSSMGFEPMQLALCGLEPHPLDPSGNLTDLETAQDALKLFGLSSSAIANLQVVYANEKLHHGPPHELALGIDSGTWM